MNRGMKAIAVLGALVLVEADPALGDPAAWSLHEFVPHPGYRAALAWRA